MFRRHCDCQQRMYDAADEASPMTVSSWHGPVHRTQTAYFKLKLPIEAERPLFNAYMLYCLYPSINTSQVS